MKLSAEEKGRRRRIYDLYRAARELETGAREAHLARTCADDASVRLDVERRLHAEEHRVRDDRSFSNVEDEFVIGEEIGRGGMGVVYRARQKSLNREVALKIALSGSYATDAERRRFAFEAEVAGQLRHPGIVPIFAIGADGDRHWISMQLIQGPSLQEVLRSGPLEPERAVVLIRKVAEAVAHAHAHGVIHRDLKPGNILLQLDEQPVITDFGLAKQLSAEMTMTETGQVLGTPHYMAPEQAAGQRSLVNTSADIYALGAVLYAMLTGQPPFQAASAHEVIRQVIEEEPPSLRKLNTDVPLELETICLKCLQKEPVLRYQTVQELIEELDRYLRGEPIEARPLGLLARSWRWCIRRPWIAGLSAAVAASLLIGSSVSVYFAIAANVRAHEAAVNAGLFRQARDVAEQRARDAEAATLTARRHAYANQMTLAQMALEIGDIEQARALLDGLQPRSGEQDLRGFEWGCLARMLESEQTAFQGHRDRVICVATAPDRPWMATGGTDQEIRIWNLETGTSITTLTGATESVIGLACSPNGRLLASASGDGIVRLWNVEDLHAPKLVGQHDAHLGQVVSVAFSPDGQFIASGGEHLLILAAVNDLENVEILEENGKAIRSVIFSRDGRSLIRCGTDGAVRVWNVATRELERTLLEQEVIVQSLDVSPDGVLLAAASWDGLVRLWEIDTWELIDMVEADAGMIRCVRFTPDGGSFVCAGEMREVRVWDVRSRQKVCQLSGHRGMVWKMAFSPVTKGLVSVGEAPQVGGDISAHGSCGEVKLWDVTAQKELEVHRRWSDRAQLAWRVPTAVFAIAPNEDASEIFAAQEDGRVTHWDVTTGKQLPDLGRFEARLRTIALSPCGRWLAAGGEFPGVTIWDRETFDVATDLKSPYHWIESAAFSPDGERLLLNDTYGEAALWSVETGERLQPYSGFDGAVTAVDVSPDGTRVATGSTEGAVSICDAATGKRIASMRHENGQVKSIRFSPGGELLATVGHDHSAYLWDATTGELVRELSGHLNQLRSVDFSPDGRRVATGSKDKTVRIWDVETGASLITLRGHRDEVSDVKFSADGKSLVVSVNGFQGHPIGQIVVWRSAEWE